MYMYMFLGDVVYFDDDGYFFIVGRIKELIKVKGFQVIKKYTMYIYMYVCLNSLHLIARRHSGFNAYRT